MRISIFTIPAAIIVLAGGVDCRALISSLFLYAIGNTQTPMMSPSANNTPTLYDTLPLTRRVNIFSSLIRDHPDLPALLSAPGSDGKSTSSKFTILAPLNSAMQSLPRKPWEDKSDYADFGEQAYDGASGQDRAQKNIERFVAQHVVPASPWPTGQEEKMRTLADTELWWEEKGEEKRRVIMPDGIEVDEVRPKAENGEIWILKGVLSGRR